MSLSWKEAIIKVLVEENRPMHYSEVSELILSRGYYQTAGATPDATVSAQITTSIKQDGENSPFVRIARGVYSFRREQNLHVAEVGSAQSESLQESKRNPAIQLDELTTSENKLDAPCSLISCLGMYWDRSWVNWRRSPKILGKQQIQSKEVDFHDQVGVYILYDRHTPIYVGRVIDRPLGTRLYEHTVDRLSGRWDRFSWFGLKSIDEDGKLLQVELRYDQASVIATFEALLIEAIEPPQNRKRGDDFSQLEFIQQRDPLIDLIEQETLLEKMRKQLFSGSKVI